MENFIFCPVYKEQNWQSDVCEIVEGNKNMAVKLPLFS